MPASWRSSASSARSRARNWSPGDVPFFLGCGAYRHHIPASVDHLIQRGEFLTSYTPYQPEIAQGTLQVLFEFQTQVARLYGCDVANASMYDGSTACWEAIAMARRITRRGKAILSGGLHPHYVSVAQDDGEVHRRRAAARSRRRLERRERRRRARRDRRRDQLRRRPISRHSRPDRRSVRRLPRAAQAAGALLIAVVTEPVALGAIRSPGEMGADIVVGEGQSIGVGLQFGGPYVGLFATREKYVRQMPGRLAGETVDAEGKRGFVLTLSTREQHIRREKATSNICTSSVLCALAFTMHMTLLGEKGLRQLAALNHAKAVAAAERLAQVPGVELVNDALLQRIHAAAAARRRGRSVRALAERGVLGGVSLGRLYPGEAGARERPRRGGHRDGRPTEDVEALAAALEEVLA